MICIRHLSVILALFLWSCVPASYNDSSDAETKCGSDNFNHIDSDCVIIDQPLITVTDVFRETYWNLYERGVAFVEAGCYHEACKYFSRAIDMWPDDCRLTPSYGMHYGDYFPNRERGLIYYRLGKLDKAKIDLQASIRSYATAKARYFWNEILKKELDLAAVEQSPGPTITIDPNFLEIWTNQSQIWIDGLVSDELYVDEIMIGDMPFFIEGVQKQIPFKANFSLDIPEQQITIKAWNLGRKSAIQTVTAIIDHSGNAIKKRASPVEFEKDTQILVHLDRSGPIISAEIVKNDNSRTYKIIGAVSDNSGLDEIRIDNKQIYCQFEKIHELSYQIDSNAENIAVVAKDRAGNTTSTELNIRHNQFADPTRNWLASLSNNLPFYFHLAANSETDTPVIELKGYFAENKDEFTVYEKYVPLQFIIYPTESMEALIINGEKSWDYSTATKSIRGKYVEHAVFSQLLSLEEGKNKISIQVVYTGENESETIGKDITIIRKESAVRSLDERLGAKIESFEFKYKGKRQDTEGFEFDLKESLKNLNRFVIPVHDSNSEHIVISGRIENSDLGREYTAVIKAISTPLEVTADIFWREEFTNTADFLLANRILLEFPLLSGIVKETIVDKKTIKTNFGCDRDLGGRKVLISKPNSKTFATANIIETGRNSLTAKINDGFPAEVGDVVITR